MKIELLDKTKKKKILEKLEESYGIEDLDYLFIKSGKDKIRAYSGNFSKEELNDLAKNVHVEVIGTRLVNMDQEDIRISFDTINIPKIKEQITKNIQEITEEQAEQWLKGEDLQIEPKTKARYIVIKHKKDILGVGRNHTTYIKNYVPKERRIR